MRKVRKTKVLYNIVISYKLYVIELHRLWNIGVVVESIVKKVGLIHAFCIFLIQVKNKASSTKQNKYEREKQDSGTKQNTNIIN